MQRDVARMFADAADPLPGNEEVQAVVSAVVDRVDLHNRYRR
jgi:hypothetical protein